MGLLDIQNMHKSENNHKGMIETHITKRARCKIDDEQHQKFGQNQEQPAKSFKQGVSIYYDLKYFVLQVLI